MIKNDVNVVDWIESMGLYNRPLPESENANAIVAVYEETQRYGGPEEGGWYYTHLELVRFTITDSADEAQELASKVQKGLDDYNTSNALNHNYYDGLPDEDEVPCPSGYSEGYIPNGWITGEKMYCYIESKPGEHTTRNVPHYE